MKTKRFVTAASATILIALTLVGCSQNSNLTKTTWKLGPSGKATAEVVSSNQYHKSINEAVKSWGADFKNENYADACLYISDVGKRQLTQSYQQQSCSRALPLWSQNYVGATKDLKLSSSIDEAAAEKQGTVVLSTSDEKFTVNVTSSNAAANHVLPVLQFTKGKGWQISALQGLSNNPGAQQSTPQRG